MVEELTGARLYPLLPHACIGNLELRVDALAVTIGFATDPLARVGKLCLQLELSETFQTAVLELALEHSSLHFFDHELLFEAVVVTACP